MGQHEALFVAKTPDSVIAEYVALRSEALKRIELRYQIINYALVVAGVLFGIGFSQKNAAPFLAYPTLSLALCWMWADNGKTIMDIGTYLRDRVEIEAFGGRGIGWETHVGDAYRRDRPSRNSSRLDVAISGGIFVAMQLLALVLAWALPRSPDPMFFFSLAGDGTVVLLTVSILWNQSQILRRHLETAEKSVIVLEASRTSPS